MATITSKSVMHRLGACALVLSLMLNITGCGVTQSISDGTVAITKAVFYKQIKTLHLTFTARDALNQDDNGSALTVVVRVYQLKSAESFAQSDYGTLLASDSRILAESLLAQKDLRLRPGEAISLDMPMEEGAEYVAVAAMFHSPEIEENTWRVVIPKRALDADDARHIELAGNQLRLRP